MEEALEKLETLQGQSLGKGENPLLVSVRSGAKFSMPGMMDTILNLGLNDQSVEALAKRSNNPRFAYDSYRRLIQMFGNVVLEIPKSAFDEVFDAKKKQKKAKLDTDLDAKALEGSHRGIQESRQEAHQDRLSARPARAADHGPRCRVPLLAQRPRQALSPHQQHSDDISAPRSTCRPWCSATWATPAALVLASREIPPPATRNSTASS